MKIFPPDNLLQDARSPDAPLMVDIGGGIGTDAIEFRRRYPDQPGRVVLQDLATVVASARDSKRRTLEQGSWNPRLIVVSAG